MTEKNQNKQIDSFPVMSTKQTFYMCLFKSTGNKMVHNCKLYINDIVSLFEESKPFIHVFLSVEKSFS